MVNVIELTSTNTLAHQRMMEIHVRMPVVASVGVKHDIKSITCVSGSVIDGCIRDLFDVQVGINLMFVHRVCCSKDLSDEEEK